MPASAQRTIGQMSDVEVICAFMEPRPKVALRGEPGFVEDHQWTHRWWKWYRDLEGHLPVHLTLDRLHLVEDRLDGKQRVAYDRSIRRTIRGGWLWHLTAEQKIDALSVVLRPLVQGH